MQTRAVPLEVRCGPTDWAVVTGWQKLLLSLAVVLPIPMLAMSGLAVPLPAAMYRAATAFVESTQGFAGVLAMREAQTLAPAPLRSVPVSDRQVVEPSSTPSGSAPRTLPVRAHTRGAGQVAAERTPAVGARRSSRSPSAPTRAVAEPVLTESTSGAASPATAGVKPAAPTSPTPSSATEQPSRPVEVAPVEPIAPPVSPPPAPSPPPPPPALEPVTKTLEPVTKPVTDVLDPVIAPVLKTGGLLGP